MALNYFFLAPARQPWVCMEYAPVYAECWFTLQCYPPYVFYSVYPRWIAYTHIVSSKFRTLFDSGLWLLLPETSIIDIYDDGIKRGQKLPIIDVRTNVIILFPIQCSTWYDKIAAGLQVHAPCTPRYAPCTDSSSKLPSDRWRHSTGGFHPLHPSLLWLPNHRLACPSSLRHMQHWC